MGIYDRQIQTARRQIEKFGGRFTWRKIGTVEGADPWKENATADVDTPNVPILIVPENMQLAEFMVAMNRGEIKSGRQKGIMPGNVSFTPDTADVVIDADGVILQIDSIDKLAPNGVEVILWYVIFKG